MKGGRLLGFVLSAAIHALLIVVVGTALFAEPERPDKTPLLPLDLNIYEPPKPAPVSTPPSLVEEPPPVAQAQPEPPSPVAQARPDPPPPPPLKKAEPEKKKARPKPQKKKEKPAKKIVEKRIPKPEPDLRKIRQQEWEQKRLAEQRRREQQRQAEQRRQEQQRLAEQRRQQLAQQRRRQAQQSQQQPVKQPAKAAAPAAPPIITNPRFHSPPRPPKYPRRALQRGIEGTTIIRASVSATGQASNVRVHRSSGNSSLDRAAVNAVKGWKFVAASRNGKNIASIVQVPVKFRIRQEADRGLGEIQQNSAFPP